MMSCSWSVMKKVLLFLIFPSVTISKPQRQNCFLGQCNQNNIGGGRGFGGGGGGLGLFGNRGNFQRFPSFNPSLNIQNCAGSQCNQNNLAGPGGPGASGGSFFGGQGGRGGGLGFPSFNPSLNIQNCRGSQCGQNNFRKKREAISSMSKPEVESHNSVVPHMTTVKNYVCAGGVVSSTCLNSHCRIICSDGVKFDADCGKLGTSLSSSPGSLGKTVVTVTCGGDPLTFPACFPFCSGTSGGGGGVVGGEGVVGGGGVSNQPSLSSQFSPSSGGCSTRSLTSCISSCPGSDQYQACVSACLAACPPQKYNNNNNNNNYFSPYNNPYSPFPPCFPFCGPF